MADYIKQITVNARLIDVTYDEWEYIEDALGSLATMGRLTRMELSVERAPSDKEDD